MDEGYNEIDEDTVKVSFLLYTMIFELKLCLADIRIRE